MSRKPISNYCKMDCLHNDWHQISYKALVEANPLKFPLEDENYFCSFVNNKIGMQINVSIMPISSLVLAEHITDWKHLAEKWAPHIINYFFDDLKFVRMSDDPRHIEATHYFHYFLYPFANN